MQFSVLLTFATAAAAASLPSLVEVRQSASNYTMDPNSLLIGTCLAIGTCYYGADDVGCLVTDGACAAENLGSICSCVDVVQKLMNVQSTKGKESWPVKCPY